MKRFLALFIFFLFGITVYAEEIEEPKELYAHSAILMDADSGRILFEKNGNEVLAMASTTKIMTCILALEEGNLEDVVTVSENAGLQPKVHLGMQKGEQYVLKDLLYSLMLESHNDSAVAIAEHVAGTVEEFANKMNHKAKKIGCENTYFITPNGLDAVDENGSHSTTAADLARIMSYCITKSEKKDIFITITGTSNYAFSNLAGTRTFNCTNRNAFLSMMDGAFSGKTGFTGKAGYCYVGALEKDGRTFVVALLACGWPNNKNYKWSDTRKLMEYGIENYTYRKVDEEIELPTIVVEDGVPESGSIFDEAHVKLKVDYGSENDLNFLLREDETVEIEIECTENLQAPIEVGEKVGKVMYCLNGNMAEEYPIVVVEYVEKRDISWVFEKVAELYFGMRSVKKGTTVN